MNCWRIALAVGALAVGGILMAQESAPRKPREIRGLWVTRWNFKTADDVRRIVRECHEAGFNTLFWQVRGQGDAFYRSALEPWGAELTGELGKDPGYDPLQLAIEETHARGMEIHAWMNTFPLWRGLTPPPVEMAQQIFNAHPDWRSVNDKGETVGLNDDYVFASPGIPAVREHVARVAFDLASRYEIDGVHLDYVRYGGRGYSHDAVSRENFKAAEKEGKSWEDFQRDQVSATVRGVYQAVKQARPLAQVSAAVWGIYHNPWNWPNVSEGYADYYQDPRAWILGDYVDFVCPMIYWPLTKTPGERLDWATLAADHVQGCAPDRVVLGLQANYEKFEEIAAEIAEARKLNARGVVLFAYPYLPERGYFDDLAEGPFRDR